MESLKKFLGNIVSNVILGTQFDTIKLLLLVFFISKGFFTVSYNF